MCEYIRDIHQKIGRIDTIINETCGRFRLNVSPIKERYDESHRFYHTWNHVHNMIFKALEHDWLTDELLLAILFHDIVYDPRRDDNEEQSVILFKEIVSENRVITVKQATDINEAILSTKNHEIHHVPKLSYYLNQLDMMIVYSPLHEFIEYEKQISKEYQFVDYYKVYKQKRIKFLKSVNTPEENITYVQYREPTIAVYAGSFNPFHKGHLNVLEKAEQIFDKVIIARGKNADKNNEIEGMPNSISYRQIDTYDGLLTDYLKSLYYPTTLIRGLRDANDLLYESNQITFLKGLMPDIKVIEIICDKEFSHISSSAIRSLAKYNKKESEKYLC